MFHEFTPWRDCDRGYGRPHERPRVFLRQAQDKLTVRRTVQLRLGSNPAVARDGCPARGASACAARGTSIFTVSQQQFMKHPG